MTPEKRLNQLEPLVADVLQKVDRLIEGQGKLAELATGTHELAINTKDELQKVKTLGEITANGLAKLTVVVSDLRDEMRERFDKSDQTQQEILSILRERLK